jgi:hypothetical protein
MRIELFSIGPDGNPNWVDVRETVKGGDVFAVHEAAQVPVDDTGRTTALSYQKMDDDRLIALFQRIVTGWSFQVPLPGSFAAAKSVLSDFEGNDLKKLRAEIKPMLDIVQNDSLPDPKTPPTDSPSGSSTET